MMKKIVLFLILFSACTFRIPAQEKKTAKIEVTNVTAFKRLDEQVTVSRTVLVSSGVMVPDSEIPVVKAPDAGIVPSQVDDLNHDGKWDELVFVCNLLPRQRLTFNVSFVRTSDAPVFKARTNVHFGKKVGNSPVISVTHEVLKKYNLPRGEGYPYQTDGPSWENDLVAYRHYFDGRNCRDVYGKRTSEMVMDTVGIYRDGRIGDTYHVLHSWGRDIFGVGQGLGAGGLAVLDGDTLVRLGVKREETTDNVDSTVFTLINRGPVRGIFRLDYFGWDVRGKKYNVHHVVSIWPGRHGYENKVWTEGAPEGKNLIVGLTHIYDQNGLIIKKYTPGLTALITHDQQSYNREYFMGLALLFPSDKYLGNFDTPKQGPGILDTYCAKLKMPVEEPLTFYVYSGWELEDKGYRNADYFIKMITHEAAMINMPARVRVIR